MMRNDHYPAGTVRNLLQTDLVSPQTKKVLQKQLNKPVVTEPTFFSKEEFATLQAVCKRLLPQPIERKEPIDLAGILDTNFSEGITGNGWRYDAMPTDDESVKKGLQAIELTAQSIYGKRFRELTMPEQEIILTDVQQKKVSHEEWNNLPSDRFFEELLYSLVEIYYSHPSGKEEIGDVSFADAKGWQRIQLNDLEGREPGVIKKAEE